MNEQTHQPFCEQPPTEAPPRPSKPQRPTWATVIGIIAVIFASLGIVNHALCTPVATVGMSTIFSGGGQQGTGNNAVSDAQRAQFETAAEYAPWTIASGCVAAALGVVLLAGGIGLLRQRRWSRPAMMWWAGLRLLHLVPAMVLSLYVQQQQADAMREALGQSGTSDPAATMMLQMMSPVFQILQLAISAVLLAAFPVFALIWFNRKTIREQMNGWPT